MRQALQIRAVKCEFNGIHFPSKTERDCYIELLSAKQAGKLKYIETQPGFDLTICGQKVAAYTADFAFHVIGRDGGFIVEAKGRWTEKDRLRYKLAMALNQGFLWLQYDSKGQWYESSLTEKGVLRRKPINLEVLLDGR
jgi:hypothetical protein